ncbi:hypothetical protein JR065_03080 [Xanthomonas sp. AmX2]|uniref:hypothetical protein n=1 Tax=Xanthomonas sp. TaxID=29446 RepID=UPI00197DDD4A|nr:hypothetical protein [Xanthomonas sp.]MBN6149310.1 hypothetical protein [Xanthomonas sp.]
MKAALGKASGLQIAETAEFAELLVSKMTQQRARERAPRILWLPRAKWQSVQLKLRCKDPLALMLGQMALAYLALVRAAVLESEFGLQAGRRTLTLARQMI